MTQDGLYKAMAKQQSGDDSPATGDPTPRTRGSERQGRRDDRPWTLLRNHMTESPAYHEHLLDASDVCNSCHRVIRVERQDPTRGGLTREFESHQERHRDHTEIGYGPADSVSGQKGVFCDRCGTESPYDRVWDDAGDERLDDDRVRELIQNTIRTLEHKGVTIDRQTLAERALQARRDSEHVDDCLGAAVDAAITRAVTRDPETTTDREVPA